ncbi:MAG: baseplate J/gp47 family protein, partial [Myxococcota bacterium]
QAPSPPMLPAPAVPQFLERVSNPVASTGGVDPESHASIKQNAPEEFQAVSYRAVRPEDYREAAERLPWVQRAGATFRWTGSWLSAFVTADPKGAVTLVDEQKDALQAQEDRFRQTGREVIVRSPRYADIDLVITLCLEPTSYRGEAIARVHSVLTGPPRADEPLPFFHPDRFSFGTLLDRSELEGAIQQVPGIRAVENIMIRRRGWFGWRLFDESHYDPGDDVVVRLMNDRSAPEQGSLRIETDGGA